MKKHNVYRHQGQLDVDMYAIRVLKKRSGDVTVRAAWIKRSSGDVIALEKLTISKSDLAKWKDVSHEYNN